MRTQARKRFTLRRWRHWCAPASQATMPPSLLVSHSFQRSIFSTMDALQSRFPFAFVGVYPEADFRFSLSDGQTGSGKTFTMGTASGAVSSGNRVVTGHSNGAGNATTGRPASAAATDNGSRHPQPPGFLQPRPHSSSSSASSSTALPLRDGAEESESRVSHLAVSPQPSEGVIPRALAALFKAVQARKDKHEKRRRRRLQREGVDDKDDDGKGGPDRDRGGGRGDDAWTTSSHHHRSNSQKHSKKDQRQQQQPNHPWSSLANGGVRLRVSYLEIYNEEIR